MCVVVVVRFDLLPSNQCSRSIDRTPFSWQVNQASACILVDISPLIPCYVTHLVPYLVASLLSFSCFHLRHIPSASASYWRGLIKCPIDPFEFELRTIECPSKGLLYDLSSQRIFQLEAVDVMLLVAISCYRCE